MDDIDQAGPQINHESVSTATAPCSTAPLSNPSGRPDGSHVAMTTGNANPQYSFRHADGCVGTGTSTT
jgi:hypothetical protein